MTEGSLMQEGDPELVASRMGWINDHLQTYLADGTKAHFVDIRDMGGYEFTQTLLLKTIGRKSGRPLIVPLLYGLYGDEVIIAGSKGGHPQHPAWFLNLQEQKEITFQIVEDRFIGPWRLAEGAERAKLWEYLVSLYPPYADYQMITEREIPVVALTRRAKIDAL